MATSALVLLVGSVLFALLVLSAYVFLRMLRPGRPNVMASSPVALNVQPMERLLSAADFQFLKRQPGFRPEMLARLRSRRAAIFAGYLSSVELEFHRLHSQLRLLVLQSGIDNPEIARALVNQRMLFSVRLVQVRFRLFLFRMGFAGLEQTGIAEAIRQLREQVDQVQVAMPSIAPSVA